MGLGVWALGLMCQAPNHLCSLSVGGFPACERP